MRCGAAAAVAHEGGADRFEKPGNAVVRNRTRRRLREALRPVYPLVKDGFLIVLVARQAAVEAPFADISADLRHVLQRAALLRDGSA